MALRVFWALILSIVIASVIYLSFVGLPSPGVEIHKKLSLPANATGQRPPSNRP